MKIGILGSGAYGLALSSILYDNKCNIKEMILARNIYNLIKHINKDN